MAVSSQILVKNISIVSVRYGDDWRGALDGFAVRIRSSDNPLTFPLTDR